MRNAAFAGIFLCCFTVFIAAERYEAEDAIVDENSIELIEDAAASGGKYVNMKEGNLSFTVTAEETGFYTLWASYSQPNDTNGKIQNLAVNGTSTGQIAFPMIDTFTYFKASSKIKLAAGSNSIDIVKSWGWVNIDFIVITPYEPTPFSISRNLVTPNASENARKMFGFILENFQKKVISGVMTNRVMENDGKYTPNTVENQEEMAWIQAASGKLPALIGLDFMHTAGPEAEDEWFIGYTNGTVALAEDMFNKGGIPVYCWHWKDPSHVTDAFYSPSASGQTPTEFDLTKAFTDPVTCAEWDTESAEYQSVVRDIDIISGYLKKLSEKGVPVLWRPLHEAAGGWFWWGYKGAAACKALYLMMFDRMVNHHGLDNLIWVWTTDEAPDALDWYPGDKCVDIIGRDYYYYPREANHGSLVASFEKVKELFGGRKVIALTEGGSVPFPEEMEADGAAWSYFMPWYGDYTMDGWAHDNTAEDWDRIMNHEYTITLDEMPGWDAYTVPILSKSHHSSQLKYSTEIINGVLEITTDINRLTEVELFRVNGSRYAVFLAKEMCRNTGLRIDLNGIAAGSYIVKLSGENMNFQTSLLVVR